MHVQGLHPEPSSAGIFTFRLEVVLRRCLMEAPSRALPDFYTSIAAKADRRYSFYSWRINGDHLLFARAWLLESLCDHCNSGVLAARSWFLLPIRGQHRPYVELPLCGQNKGYLVLQEELQQAKSSLYESRGRRDRDVSRFWLIESELRAELDQSQMELHIEKALVEKTV
ncbi:hypothetical protein KSP40_PGU007625 [Platanthera guangdongensis]|uniref:Uncharacterized protein n=1 Tax=Platanthera guangdongensis TaxID=2320717 RepID=A0ABR2M4E1_9ASPA